MWAEISSRRPSGPATHTGGASPLCTITTCSRAASWWSCSPSSSTCCGCGAFTGGPRAVARPPPSGWRTAFRPRRSPAPYEPEFEPQKDSNGKAIFASGFLLFILICLVFSFPFSFLETKPKPTVPKLCCPRSIAFSRSVSSFKLRNRGKGNITSFLLHRIPAKNY